jgi:hypothetical protein
MTRPDSQAGSPSEKTVAQLGAKLEKHLFAYATAATAAGVGVLAWTQPAEAKIVYTKANVSIIVNGGAIPLDLNNDGIPDFAFSNLYTIGGRHRDEGTHGGAVVVFPAQPKNEIWEVASNGRSCAAALAKGVRVGPKGPLVAKSLVMAGSAGNYTNGGTAYGPWLGVQQAYLGLKFAIHGKMHYGWARITWNGIGSTEYITGYAYETVVNKPILTGKTKGPAADGTAESGNASSLPVGGLGNLARGSAGLANWRNQ